MPSHTFIASDPELGEYNVEVEFRITFSGFPGAYLEPAEPVEIELEGAATWRDSSPDSVTVYEEASAIPADLYDKWEAEVLDHFDFDDYYRGIDEAEADYRNERP